MSTIPNRSVPTEHRVCPHIASSGSGQLRPLTFKRSYEQVETPVEPLRTLTLPVEQ